MKKIFLVLILLLAVFVRFYRLGDFPAFNADEAAIGYNAYSLLETGKDEHGNSWPIHFQSFNDYKPGLYFYLTLPFIFVFGPSELSVRLPGAIIGVITTLLLYFLVRELFKDEFSKSDVESFALSSALFLAISPWHIHFSRGAWEANVATFFITLGVFFLVKYLNRNNYWYLLYSLLAFIASLYTYHAARVIVPFFVLIVFLINKKLFLRTSKRLIILSILGLLLLIPLAAEFKKGALSRAGGVSIFSDTGPTSLVNEQRGEHGDIRSLFGKLLHNKPINYTFLFASNWLEHYWGEFLFLSGDEIQRNKVPETGQMYMIDIIFIAAGIITIIRRPKNWQIIIIWLLIAPSAAALTFQSPHALRANNMVIPLVLISSYGFFVLLKFFQNLTMFKKLSYLPFILLNLLLVFSFLRYFHMYQVHMAKEYPFSSQYGVKELVAFLEKEEKNASKVIVTDRYDQPYILFLFFLKYPPEKFQNNHMLLARDKFGFSTVRNFDKYYFYSISDWDEIRTDNQGALIAGTEDEIPGGNVIKRIYFPNGQVAFKIIKN